jgi:hypothetical protein
MVGVVEAYATQTEALHQPLPVLGEGIRQHGADIEAPEYQCVAVYEYPGLRGGVQLAVQMITQYLGS